MKEAALGELWLPEARATAFAPELPWLISLLGAELWAAWGALDGSEMAEFWVGPHTGCWQSPSGGCWGVGSLHSGFGVPGSGTALSARSHMEMAGTNGCGDWE